MAGEVPLSLLQAGLQSLYQCDKCHILLPDLESYVHHDCASYINGMYNFGQLLAEPETFFERFSRVN